MPSVAVTYCILHKLGTPLPIRPFAACILGVLLSLIGYYAGNFWDSSMFDPIYGKDGRWIAKETRTYHLFPAGADLDRYRQEAVTAIFSPQHSGTGIYREAESRARSNPSQWAEIEPPLILSKFIRSYIWPCASLAAILLVYGLWVFIMDFRHLHLKVLAAGLLLAIFSVLLFVPYFNLRVEHMIRLYQWAAREGSDKLARH